jgi:hypothetical protein
MVRIVWRYSNPVAGVLDALAQRTVAALLAWVLLLAFAPFVHAADAAADGTADGADPNYLLHWQATEIWQRKNAFPAAYTNLNGTPNSLSPVEERSWTTTATMFLGLKPWNGAEIFFVPEMISELPMSGLHGLAGAIANGELEKNGLRQPTFYRSRLFLRQTWGLGGTSDKSEDEQMQFAKTQQSRRFVLTAGNLSIIDIFDKNAYAGDVRQQFLSMNFLTYSAYDFAADARGYSWGVAGEYYYDDWAVRAGRFLAPRDPNQLQLNYSIFNSYGDQAEIEHKHTLAGQPGRVRMLVYRNRDYMGQWNDAVNDFLADPNKNATTCTNFSYGSGNAGAPDLCWARRMNVKVGAGASIEQALGDDAGMFLRAMKSDGKTEVDSFVSADSSFSAGAIVTGKRWGRADDSAGIGFAQGGLSSAHVNYLNMGGIDGFIGDGKINYRPERTFEVYYNIKAAKYVWLTLDFQRIDNPAYNADRGPVTVGGFRLHFEL